MSDFCAMTPIGGLTTVSDVPAATPAQPCAQPPAAAPLPDFAETLRAPLERNAELAAALTQIVAGFTGEKVVAAAAEGVVPEKVSGLVEVVEPVRASQTAPTASVEVRPTTSNVFEQPVVVETKSPEAAKAVVETTAPQNAVAVAQPVETSVEATLVGDAAATPVTASVPASEETAETIEQPAVETDVRRTPTVAKARPEVQTENEAEDPVKVVLQAAPQVAVAPAVDQVAPADAKTAVASVDAVAPVASSASVSASEAVLAAAHAVADTLLVSPGLLRGEGEIRVQLKPDVLDGSAVNITVTGRTIAVSFVPATEASASLLTGHVGELEAHLNATVVGYEMAVSVVRPETAAAQVAGLSGVYSAATTAGLGAVRGSVRGARRT